MKLFRFLCVAALLGICHNQLTICATANDQPSNSPNIPEFTGPITAEHVRPHVEYLASPRLEGRGGARGKRLAAEYLAKYYRSLGLRPLFSDASFFQNIPGTPDEEGRETIRGRNVAAWLPGSDPKLRDEYVIVSAHYDHLGIRDGELHPGADDNATGVAMVLEVARQLASRPQPPRRSFVFINFDLEEYLLWGSRWFVAHPPWPIERVKLFITADLIGRSLGDLPTRNVFVVGGECAPALERALQVSGRPTGIRVDRLGVDLIGTRSDYGPFRDNQIPFLFFSTGEHPDYHTPRDTPDKIDYPKLAGISSLILRVVQHVANEDRPPIWSPRVETGLSEVHALHCITQTLLDADAAGSFPLGGIHRFFISNMHHKMGKILDRGKLHSDERPWLIRTSQFLLLTVF